MLSGNAVARRTTIAFGRGLRRRLVAAGFAGVALSCSTCLAGEQAVAQTEHSAARREHAVAQSEQAVALDEQGREREPSRSQPQPQGHELSYRLEWRRDRILQSAGAAGWGVVTDLGYHVRLLRGYLVSHSTEFVECAGPRRTPGAGSRSPESGLRSMLAWLFGPPVALAGHGSVAPNPARINIARVESLLSAEAIDLGSVRPPPSRYCKVHYLIARADRETLNLPEDVNIVGASLYVEGRYRRPPSSDEVSFELKSSAANGRFSDIRVAGLMRNGTAANEIDSGQLTATAIIQRNLGTLFDRIDFATMPKREIEWQLLKNVIDSTEIRVELCERH